MIFIFTFLLCKTIRDNYDLESQLITFVDGSSWMTTFKKIWTIKGAFLRKKYSTSPGYESLILSTTIGSCVIFLLVLGSSLHIIFRRLVLSQQYSVEL